jgi:type IV pilus assembly PilX-like protein
MKPLNTLKRKQTGIALITTLLLLLLMSAMVVGFILLVMEGQRLSGMNIDQSKAFYGAESGMEKLTADLGALFGITYAPSGPQVNALMLNPPVLPASTGVTYVDAAGTPTYRIDFPKDGNGNPQAQFAQITSGSSPYEGMTALETTYTLTVAALTGTGGEVKLQRTAQTVGIPLFQFGIYCEGDCGFFPGPNFNFGGRVHTNGNLFLNSGGPAGAGPTNLGSNQLWLASPITAAKDIFRDCLSNTHAESPSGNHPGSVEITKGGGSYQALGFGQGSRTSCLTSGVNTNWPAISASFNGNLRSGVKPLNLTITLLGNGATQPIDLIRRPVRGEDAINPGVLGERYFAEASLKILLSDNAADITNLPCVSAGAPFNLADIARPVANWITANAINLNVAMTAAGTPRLPLAASGAATAAYVPGTAGGDGYWQTNGRPVITGFIKIDAQTAYGVPCGTWKDVTQEILSLGYAGKNINPVPQSFDNSTLNTAWPGTNAAMDQGKSPALPNLPTVQMSGQNGANLGAGNFTANNTAAAPTGTCKEPHPNAVVRLERIRDNPSSVPATVGIRKTSAPTNLPVTSTVAEVCGVDPTTGNLLANLRATPASAPGTGLPWIPQPSDFWPNVLFDTREGYNREPAPTGVFLNRITLGGAMNYVELDVKNLARWFSGAIGASGLSTRDPNVAPNNFVVYISDRRSNYVPVAPFAGIWPPLSPTGNESGEYGYSDFVNSGDIKGCPNNALDTGEDLDGTNVLYTYGDNSFPNGLLDSTNTSVATLFANSLNATVADPLCAGPNGGFPWARTFLFNPNEARENPSSLFRRAVKLANGSRINLPLCPGAVTCGLTITTENPAYVQGDYNANSAGGGWADPNVAASVISDAFTFLSNDWSDINSFSAPFCASAGAPCLLGRDAGTAWYRLGVVAGKGISFPIPNWNTTAIDGSQDFGTDGGVHNFMRYLENWNGTLNYQGSIVSLYYNRQATGLYNSGNNNYSPPNRGYIFDANFLNPLLLPPRTPMFRDVNTTGFTQLLLPNQ